MAVVDGFRLAVGTLTRFPVRPPNTVDAPQMRAALWWFIPVSVVLVSLPVCAGWGLVQAGAPPLAAAVVAIAGLAWLSRGLHWDGLADTADGLHVSWDRPRALKVMRASDIGPMGVLAIVFTAALQIVCLAQLWSQPLLVVILPMALGRWLVGLACGICSAAQPDGLGAGFFRACSPAHGWLLAAVAAGLVSTMVFCAVSWWVWCAVVGAALTSVVVVCRMTRRDIGGATGDTLGAVVEVATAAALLAAATAA